MSNEIVIENKVIGGNKDVFFVAEMSGNHNQSLDRALAIVDAAARAGASALKIQTYTSDTMTLDMDEREFFIHDEASLWKGQSLHQLYGKAYTPWEWHQPIFDRCRQHGLIGFSTPFDETSLDFLESLSVPLYKIASFENVDIPLIRKVASTKKPLIISTGMATVDEMDEAVAAARDAGCRELILLKCVSAYPAPAEDANLLTMRDLKSRYGCLVGLSDHSLGMGVSIAAATLGAEVIERHLTMSRRDGGVDAAFSLEPEEMMLLVGEARKAKRATGRVSYGPVESEKQSTKFRRSIYVARDMKKDTNFTKENVRVIRPGLGLAPKHYDEILKKKAACDLKKGTPLIWDHVA